MNRITTVQQVKQDTRFLSSKIEDKRIAILIEEAEQMYIKQQIGESLYVDILKYLNDTDQIPLLHYQLLLDGGVYEDQGGQHHFVGLVQTLNYYVYAKLVRHQNYTLTRAGMVVKESEYSSPLDSKERMLLEKDTLAIADCYRNDCLSYLEANKQLFPLYANAKIKNRLNFKLIGGRK